MEYNKTKKTLEKVAGIFSIVSATLYILIAAILLIVGTVYGTGGFNTTSWEMVWDDYSQTWVKEYYTDEYYNYTDEYYNDYSVPYFMFGLPLLTMAILMLVFSIKLIKSPFLANGELRNKKAARIWVLVLSILMGDFVVMGLMIAVLCLKDFKEPTAQSQMYGPSRTKELQQGFMSHNLYAQAGNQDAFLEFYNKIEELKKLKSLDIIDDTAYKKAVTKIVVDLTKE